MMPKKYILALGCHNCLIFGSPGEIRPCAHCGHRFCEECLALYEGVLLCFACREWHRLHVPCGACGAITHTCDLDAAGLCETCAVRAWDALRT